MNSLTSNCQRLHCILLLPSLAIFISLLSFILLLLSTKREGHTKPWAVTFSRAAVLNTFLFYPLILLPLPPFPSLYLPFLPISYTVINPTTLMVLTPSHCSPTFLGSVLLYCTLLYSTLRYYYLSCTIGTRSDKISILLRPFHVVDDTVMRIHLHLMFTLQSIRFNRITQSRVENGKVQ